MADRWIARAAALALAAALATPGVAQEPIRIGALYNLTGGMASIDGPSLSGAQLAAKQINEAGRPPGWPADRGDRDRHQDRPAGDREGGAAPVERGRGRGDRLLRHHLRHGGSTPVPGRRQAVRDVGRDPSDAAAVGRRLHVHDAVRRRRSVLRDRRLHVRQAGRAPGRAVDRQLDGLHQGPLRVLQGALHRARRRDRRRGPVHDGRHRLLGADRAPAVDRAGARCGVRLGDPERGRDHGQADPRDRARAADRERRRLRHRAGGRHARPRARRRRVLLDPHLPRRRPARGHRVRRGLHQGVRPRAGERVRAARLRRHAPARRCDRARRLDRARGDPTGARPRPAASRR